MKRIAILLTAAALLASTATIALADDDASDIDDDATAETSEPRDFNEAEVQKLDALAGFLLADPSAAGGDDKEDGDLEGDDAGFAEEAAMDAAVEQIVELRYGENGTGWGAIFKLLQLAKASETSLSELLLDIGEDDGWAFGRRFKEVSEPGDSRADDPKNFGQLKKRFAEENGTHAKKPKKS